MVWKQKTCSVGNLRSFAPETQTIGKRFKTSIDGDFAAKGRGGYIGSDFSDGSCRGSTPDGLKACAGSHAGGDGKFEESYVSMIDGCGGDLNVHVSRGWGGWELDIPQLQGAVLGNAESLHVESAV